MAVVIQQTDDQGRVFSEEHPEVRARKPVVDLFEYIKFITQKAFYFHLNKDKWAVTWGTDENEEWKLGSDINPLVEATLNEDKDIDQIRREAIFDLERFFGSTARAHPIRVHVWMHRVAHMPENAVNLYMRVSQ